MTMVIVMMMMTMIIWWLVGYHQACHGRGETLRNRIGHLDSVDVSDYMLHVRRFDLAGKLHLALLQKSKRVDIGNIQVVEQGHEGVGDTEVETEVRFPPNLSFI